MAKNVTQELLAKPNDVRATYDWPVIRREYITGIEDEEGRIVYPSLSELAERHGFPNVKVLENRSAREKWSVHRKAERNRVEIEKQKQLQKTLVKKQIRFDEKAADDAMQTQIALGKRIKQLAQLVELDNVRVAALMERVENGEQITKAFREELRSLVSAAEWESLWKAYALANEVGRKALGMKDDDGPRTTVEITQINNTGASESLREVDRTTQLLQVLQNPNLVIPGVTVDTPELEAGEQIQDAEVVDDDA